MLPMCPCLVLVESLARERLRLRLRLTLLFSMELPSHPSMVPTPMESTLMSLASLLPVSMLLTFLSPVLERRRERLKLMPRFSLLDTPMLESMPQTQCRQEHGQGLGLWHGFQHRGIQQGEPGHQLQPPSSSCQHRGQGCKEH